VRLQQQSVAAWMDKAISGGFRLQEGFGTTPPKTGFWLHCLKTAE